MKNLRYEPVLVRSLIVGVLTAVLHVLVLNGVLGVDAESTYAGLIDVIGLTVAAVWSRSGVIPVAKVEDIAADSAVSSEEVIAGRAEEPMLTDSSRVL